MIETLTLDTRKCDSPVGKARIAPLRRGERNNTPLTVSVRRDRRPYDLTGMTAHLLWQTADGKLVGPIPMEVSDPAAGTVRCTLPDACYSAVGMARAYIELRRGAELVDTTDELVVKVLDCIDADGEQAEEYKPLIAEVRDAIEKALESRIIHAEAETLDPGSDATVSLVPEDGAQCLRLGVPRGDTGAKGDPFTYDDFTESQIAELQRPATEAAAAMAIPRFDLSAMGAQVGDWVDADTRSLYKALTSGITKCAFDYAGMHFEWNTLAIKITDGIIGEYAQFSNVFTLNSTPVLVLVDVTNGEEYNGGRTQIRMVPLAEVTS